MQLNLKKPLIFFDLETTGINITKDKIVEISLIKVMPNGEEMQKTRRLNPGMHIPEQSTAIHHITDDDVKDCPTFKQIAKDLARIFEGCDVAGFNSNRFDVPMLEEEVLNAGVDFDFSKCRFTDVQTIFHKKEQRNLAAAYKFYCGKELGDVAWFLAEACSAFGFDLEDVMRDNLLKLHKRYPNGIFEVDRSINRDPEDI